MRRARALRTVVLGVVPLLFTVSLAGAQILPTPCVPPPGNPPDDFLTGGGFINATATDLTGAAIEPQSRKNFGVGGGCKQGGDGHGLWGHLEYVDHGNGLNVHWMTITTYSTDNLTALPDPNARLICGTARTNDPNHPNVFFGVRAADQGLPDGANKFDIQLMDQTSGAIFYTTFVAGFPHTPEGGNIKIHKPNPSTMGSISNGPCNALLGIM